MEHRGSPRQARRDVGVTVDTRTNRIALHTEGGPMSRSTPASSPEPERTSGEPAPLVDALGGHTMSRPARPATIGEPDHHRGPRRHPALRLAAIAAVVVLVLLAVVLIV
jgi:hypothetical protein